MDNTSYNNEPSNDYLNLYTNDKWNFTLDAVCKIIGAELPNSFSEIKGSVIEQFWLNDIPMSESKSNELQLLFNSLSMPVNSEKLQYIKNNNIIIISEEPLYYEQDSLPVILVKDVTRAWCKIGKYMKIAVPMPTIGITGSIGKTTTVKFAQCVFSEKYRVFVSGLNRNVPGLVVRRMLKEYGPNYTMHIQETGGGDIKRVEHMATFLNTDAFGITKIEKKHHLDKYITSDNLINDKTSFDRYGKKNQIGIINADDEVLLSYNFKSQMLSFGIKNKNADFVASDIIQNGNFLEFNVNDHKETVHIKIQIPGVHNVYNALMVFVLAKHFGLTNEQIQRGFLNYKSSGIRQSIKEIAGRTVYIDCFNVCQASILSCCETLSQMKINKKNKRIAVLGGENALGEYSYITNLETGELLAKYDNIDYFIFVGIKTPATLKQVDYFGNGRALYEGALNVAQLKERSIFFDDLTELADFLREKTESGDAILLKGLYRLPLFTSLDIAFGTSYLSRNINFKPKKVCKTVIEGQYYEQLGGILTKYKTNQEVISLPDTIEGVNLIRIGIGVFKNSKIKHISLPGNLKSIGACAFLASDLRDVTLPNSVLNIEYGAFAKCKNLVKANLSNIETIGERAFKDCRNLEVIVLSNKVLTIDDSAFLGCEKLKLIVEPNSFAATYAMKHKIPIEYLPLAE